MRLIFLLPGAVTEDNGEKHIAAAINTFGLVLNILVLLGSSIAAWTQRRRDSVVVKAFYGTAMSYSACSAVLFAYRLHHEIAGSEVAILYHILLDLTDLLSAYCTPSHFVTSSSK